MTHREDLHKALQEEDDDAIIEALAHASREHDPYLANVLATEAMNRMQRARAVLAELGEGVLAIDGEGRIQEANAAATKMLGTTRSALLERDVHDALAAHDAGGVPIVRDVSKVLAALRDGAETRCDEDCFTRADGTRFPVSYCVMPLTRGATMSGCVVSFHDITERRAHERERARWAELMSAFYVAHDSVGIGLVVVQDGKLLHANDAFRALVPQTSKVADGKLSLMELVHPDDRAATEEHFRRVLIEGAKNAPWRLRLLCPTGSAPVEVAVAPAQGDARDPHARLVCIVRPRLHS